jgi:hypothetical protein
VFLFGKLRLIFRSSRKNDRVDAEKLAKLLFLDEVPPVHVPSVEVRSWRSMIEHHRKLVAAESQSDFWRVMRQRRMDVSNP